MTVVAENGKGPAGSQTYDLAEPRRKLALLRVLKWPPDSETAATRPRVSAAHICQAGGRRHCQEMLEIAVNLLQALLAATDGRTDPLSGTKLSEMKGRFVGSAGERYGLTAREKQVLAEMVEGKSNRQIAVTLTVCVSTIKSHVSNILSKMGVESRTAAVGLALRQHGKFGFGHTESGATSEAGNSCPLSD